MATTLSGTWSWFWRHWQFRCLPGDNTKRNPKAKVTVRAARAIPDRDAEAAARVKQGDLTKTVPRASVRAEAVVIAPEPTQAVREMALALAAGIRLIGQETGRAIVPEMLVPIGAETLGVIAQEMLAAIAEMLEAIAPGILGAIVLEAWLGIAPAVVISRLPAARYP